MPLLFGIETLRGFEGGIMSSADMFSSLSVSQSSVRTVDV